jgi:acyl carrier protein
MFAALDSPEAAALSTESGRSILDVLAATPVSGRPEVVSDHVQHLVAAVFDCAVTDIDPDAVLDDIGLDSMMAMDFRVRINTTFSIDLPVLEILKGVSVNTLAVRVLAELEAIHGEVPSATDATAEASEPAEEIGDVDQLLNELSEADLRELLAELEGGAVESEAGEQHS